MPDGSNQLPAIQNGKPPTIHAELDRMSQQFAMALPAHIPVDRFKRIAITAINRTPDLLSADRRSLLGACQRAAEDGLLPDGREGALVIFNTKVKENGQEKWIKAVQWMPMIYGILKKMRQSGEVASITARAAYENDRFHYVMGDDEHLEHEPNLDNPGELRLVYAIAKLKDGEVVREVMTRAQIEKVRKASKQKDKDGNPTGPWRDWYDEMARKSVVRRLAKYMPQSSELDRVLQRDDAIEAALPAPAPAPKMIEADSFERAADGAVEIEHEPAGSEVVDPSTGEVTDAGAEHRDASQPETARDKPVIDTGADVFWTGTLEVKPEPRGKTGDFYFGKWEQEIARRINEAATEAALDDLLKANARHLGTHKLKRASDAADIAEAIVKKRNSFAPAEG